MSINLLIVEDEAAARESVRRWLEQEGGFVISEAGSGDEALTLLGERPFDVVLLDLGLPGLGGRQVLARAARAGGPLFIVVTAEDDAKVAVECMKAGAYDYLVKPFNLEELNQIIRRAAEHAKIRDQIALLSAGAGQRFAEMIGRGPAMQRVFELVRRAAAAPAATVLVGGESGTGKELAARAIHRESVRAERPFVAVNCTAVQENLLESEFFGHERGAFTDAREAKKGLLEIAEGGTILLDEIGDMSPKLQAKLLRFLEDRTFRRLGGTQTQHSDVRIIAATNRDLEAAIAAGQFRQDLYFRLKVLPVNLPPLRERREDIPLLAGYFLDEFCTRQGAARKEFSGPALAALAAYSWPGNIRELRNLVERIVILEDATLLTPRHLPPEIRGDAVETPPPLDVGRMAELPYSEAKQLYVERFTRDYVSFLLSQHAGNVTQSALRANMDRANFQRLMRRVGISAQDFGREEETEAPSMP